MKRHLKVRAGRQDHGTTDRGTAEYGEGAGRVLVSRLGLAAALGVSLRTVDRMLAAGEIVPLRIRGTVRFYVPEVVECLRNPDRKWGRRAVISEQSSVIGGQGAERTQGT